MDADKLDQLINLVGELIIAGASVNLIAHRSRVIELSEATSKLATLVEEVRDSALQLRMVRIGATFSRFQRVVHDVSRDLGKDIVLHIDGEDTELDKTVQTRFILHRFAIYFAQRLAQRKLLRRIEKSTELTVASKTGVG